MPSNAALVIAAKYPDPGIVKTRLARRLGFGLATELYRAFLRDMDAKLTGAFPAVYWGYAPEAAPFPEFLGPGRNYLVQEGDDLGERMFNLFRVLMLQGFEKVVLVGSDLPHLSPRVVTQAFERLDKREVVLGPSEDGGYYLLGMRDTYDLFSDMTFSTSTVFAETLMRAAEQGLTVDLVPKTFDVDQPGDIDKLQAFLADKRNRGTMPHTAAALSRLKPARSNLGDSRVGRYFDLTPDEVDREEQDCLKVVRVDGQAEMPLASMAKAHMASVAKVAQALVERLREDLEIPLSDISVVAAKYHDAYRNDDRSHRLRPYGPELKGLFIPHDGHEARLAYALRKTGAKSVAQIVRQHNVLSVLRPEERTIDENILLIADAMVEGAEIVPIRARKEAVIKRHAADSPERAWAFEMAFYVVERTMEMYIDAGLNWRQLFAELSSGQ